MSNWTLAAARQALMLLGVIVTTASVLFFLLRLTGDPAIALAGLDASPEQIAAIRSAYGLDQPLLTQYFAYLKSIAAFDFGASIATGQSAIGLVLKALPATLFLAGAALSVTLLVAVPLGGWLGMSRPGAGQSLATGALFIMQGVPGFVTALLLIQIFSITWPIAPSFGLAGPQTWILPIAGLSAFLIPQVARLVSVNVREAMAAPYARTARAAGASETSIVLRDAMPNAMLGVVALMGAQASFLLSGAAVTETIFGWPGLGALLIASSQTLDFPVVQALAIVTACLVFAANLFADAIVAALDPRIRGAAA